MKKLNRFNFVVWICLLLLCIVIVIFSFLMFHYDSKIDVGMGTESSEQMKQYSVAIMGCTKSNTKYIQNTLRVFDQLGAQFKRYSVIVYENDSNDDTRIKMMLLKKNNYHYLFEDNVKEPSRIIRIGNCRRKLLEKLNITDPFVDYIIMIDMDNVMRTGMIVDTLKTSFTYKTSIWDEMTANQLDVYYDTYALKTNYFNYQDYIAKDMKSIHLPYPLDLTYATLNNLILRPQHGLMRVYSAFGGVAIYNATMGLKCAHAYSGLDNNGNEICEHVNFNTCMLGLGAKIFINNAMLTGYTFDLLF